MIVNYSVPHGEYKALTKNITIKTKADDLYREALDRLYDK